MYAFSISKLESLLLLPVHHQRMGACPCWEDLSSKGLLRLEVRECPTILEGAASMETRVIAENGGRVDSVSSCFL